MCLTINWNCSQVTVFICYNHNRWRGWDYGDSCFCDENCKVLVSIAAEQISGSWVWFFGSVKKIFRSQSQMQLFSNNIMVIYFWAEDLLLQPSLEMNNEPVQGLDFLIVPRLRIIFSLEKKTLLLLEIGDEDGRTPILIYELKIEHHQGAVEQWYISPYTLYHSQTPSIRIPPHDRHPVSKSHRRPDRSGIRRVHDDTECNYPVRRNRYQTDWTDRRRGRLRRLYTSLPPSSVAAPGTRGISRMCGTGFKSTFWLINETGRFVRRNKKIIGALDRWWGQGCRGRAWGNWRSLRGGKG